MFTLKLILVFNIGAFGLMILLTMLLIKGSQRVNTVGWICAAFSVAVFAAPLSIMMRVVRTRSVEFMPFPLSLFLTLSATTWFLYGLFVKDFFIALPNVLGFLFGIAQMALYMIYKNAKKEDKGATEIKMSTTENICHENEQCKEMKSAMVMTMKCEHIESNESNV
ncbi:bidirectional sugar transporter SWEET9-like [Jatropha curcas]|uniref:bidirectional sugar transporter SWEET9-like n=1 Tax=Jatropha curcas TaxID=180498 RepID=UPI0018956B3E|nr:bidirectional sugar transporter SWEET9-like [Jatropha curcas]